MTTATATPTKKRAAKKTAPAKDSSPEQALIRITVPKNCKRTHLSVNALDSHTRELAWKTIITANGQPLLCDSFKVTDKGTVLIEVRPSCFEISEAAQ